MRHPTLGPPRREQRIRRMIRTRPLCNSKTAKFSSILTIMLLVLVATVLGDPVTLITNGDFENQNFTYKGLGTIMDVSHDGRMDFIPFFTVMRGAVQIQNAIAQFLYANDSYLHGLFLLHLNSITGPGVIQTTPLVTPRKGATYNCTFTMADNPDGGPFSKALQISVLVNNQFSRVKQVPFSVSDPYSTRRNLAWRQMSFVFVGTGESTILQFESISSGPYGPLIDNIQVTLITLVENGSFENFTGNRYRDIRTFTVLKAPSSLITGWQLTEGEIKYSLVQRWQPSTDKSICAVDLNAGSKSGTILSAPFSTVPGFSYKVLFDATANPDGVPPVEGAVVAAVYSPPGELVAYRWAVVNGEGFSEDSAGWVTYLLDFRAQANLSTVEFSSMLIGTFYGPLLDNVNVFQVCDPGPYKKVPRTFSAGVTSKLSDSSWIVILALLMACHLVHIRGI